MQTNVSEKYRLFLALQEKIDRMEHPLYNFVPNSDHYPIIEALENGARNVLILGSNQSGKSELSCWYIVKKCVEKPKFRVLVLTYYKNLPNIQEKILKYLPLNVRRNEELCKWKPNRREFVNQTVGFENGSWIRFLSYETGVDALGGSTVDAILMDEECPTEHMYNEMLFRLIVRNGFMIRAMTPINGITYTYNHLDKPNVKHFYISIKNNPYVDKEKITEMERTMDARTIEMRIGGKFVNMSSGRAYNLETDNIVTDYYIADTYNLKWQLEPVINIGMDFNYDYMSAVCIVARPNCSYVFDEIQLTPGTTQMMCDEIRKRYPNKKFRFVVDEHSKNRSTSTSLTDHKIIKANFPNSYIDYSHVKNVRDRVFATCARIRSADNKRHLFINEKCKLLITDLNVVTWDLLGEGHKKQYEKTHLSDALSYYVYFYYPLDKTEIQIYRNI